MMCYFTASVAELQVVWTLVVGCCCV